MPQVTRTILGEGDARITLKLDFMSDGTGELVFFPVLYPSDLTPKRPNKAPAFRIMQVWYGLVWFDVTFYSADIGTGGSSSLQGGSTDPMWTLARDCDSYTDFRPFGGIIDPSVWVIPPQDDTGILLVSTNGFAPLGSQGSVVLDIRKTNY